MMSCSECTSSCLRSETGSDLARSAADAPELALSDIQGLAILTPRTCTPSNDSDQNASGALTPDVDTNSNHASMYIAEWQEKTIAPSSDPSGSCMFHCNYNRRALQTSVSTLPPPTYNIIPSSIPWPGLTYIIQQQTPIAPGKVLAVDGNNLHLKHRVVDDDPSTHWTVHASSGNWLGLRNVLTGKFLGNTGSDNLIVRAGSLQEWEFMEIRPHPHGECYIYNKCWNWKKGVSENLDLRGQPGKWYFYQV